MRLVRRLVTFLAYAYPLALLVTVAALKWLGPHLWQAELALYVPRILFGVPLPFISVALFALRLRRTLWTQLVAAWVVLFPLMGGTLPGWPRHARDAAKALRIMSYNGNFAYGGSDALAQQVRTINPDIALFQQLFNDEKLIPILARSYREVRSDGEFLIASRFHVRSTLLPARLPYGDRTRSPRFIRYEIEAPFAPFVVYSVHPISPLFQLIAARGGGLRKAIKSGALFSLAPRPDIEYDTGLRYLQVRAFANKARNERLPLIIAGDTNMPGLSPGLSYLSHYRDGFADVGTGFGYTFPSNRAWMRIDRIFAGDDFRFLDFGVGRSHASDHLCVFADLELDRE